MGRNNRDEDLKNANSLLRDVFAAVAFSDLKVPNITHWRQTLGGLATADIKLVQVLQHMTRQKNSYIEQITTKYLSVVIQNILPFRGFNKHRRPTKRVGYIAQRSRLFFSPKKKQLV